MAPQIDRDALTAVIEADFMAGITRKTHYVIRVSETKLRVSPGYMQDETVLEVCRPPAVNDNNEE